MMRAIAGAALLSSLTLVIPAAPAVFAAGEPPAQRADVHRPGGGGSGFGDSDTPAQTRTSARVAVGDPTEAARQFLADRRSTYHIASPASDLSNASRATEKGVTTVRFNQRYQGLPVAGAQYVVRTTDQGSSNVVTGTSGQYFTDLDVDVSHPLSFGNARRAAVYALRTIRWDTTPRVTDRGSTVVPVGHGVLTRHVQVTGYDLGHRKPVRQQLYINALTGRPVLSFDNLAFDGPVDTTGASINGGAVPLKAFAKTGGGYELRDRSRSMYASHGGEILTRDAKGGDVFLFVDDELPPRLQPVQSSTKKFPSNADGANDAHWAAGQVYEFYRGLGRDSLDGNGGTINSVVGVTDFGEPFPNAFWNGSYMVYGNGGYGYKPFSSALDVVGHEMTHGVIEHTSNLMYLGQSGTINEAAADYLGNAIQNTVEHISPSSSLDGLLGEQLCKKATPAKCAQRNMDKLATTKGFAGIADDNGGVHVNSTIVSGSWWQIRHQLGATVADALVYKTVTQYLTPLSQFIDARDATISAAADSGLSAAQVDVVRKAFTDHGIVDNWEQTRLGVDSHVLRTILGYPFVYPKVAGQSWYAADLLAATDDYPSILTGQLTGDPAATRLSPDDGAYYDLPDTDGTSVAWIRIRPTDGRTYVQSKELGTGTVTTEDFVADPFIFDLRVSGRTFAYSGFGQTDGQNLTVLRPDGSAKLLEPSKGRTFSWFDVQGNQVVYAVERFDQKDVYIRAYNSVTGTNRVLTVLTNHGRRLFFADLTLTPHHVVFQVDRTIRTPGTSIVTMDRNGEHRGPLVREDSPSSVKFGTLTATDDVVSYTTTNLASTWGDTYLKQLPTNGGAIRAVSCSHGYKGAPATDTGKGVAWVDFSTGLPQIVNRAAPVGSCG